MNNLVKEKEFLALKWGTIKGWNNFSDNSMKLLKKFFEDGVPMSAMLDRPEHSKKLILWELIDQLDGEIENDWSGEILTKEQAKKYVMEYGN